MKRILIILGHPARERRSFCEALVDAYQDAALAAGHEVRRINLAALRFDPTLHEGYSGNQPIEPDIAEAQQHIRWAEHVVWVYPLWLLMPPALVKGFLERTWTEAFMQERKDNPDKTARILQTMGMPTPLYNLIFDAHGAKAMKNMLGFCGFESVELSFFGAVETLESLRQRYLRKVTALGRKGL